MRGLGEASDGQLKDQTGPSYDTLRSFNRRVVHSGRRSASLHQFDKRHRGKRVRVRVRPGGP